MLLDQLTATLVRILGRENADQVHRGLHRQGPGRGRDCPHQGLADQGRLGALMRIVRGKFPDHTFDGIALNIETLLLEYFRL